MIDFKPEAYALNSIILGISSEPYVSILTLTGPIITLDEVLNGDTTLDYEGQLRYQLSHIEDNLTALGKSIVTYSTYPNSILDYDLEDLKLKLNFNTGVVQDFYNSVRDEDRVEVNQYMLAFHDREALDRYSDYSLFILGSLGTLGSGAEIEVSDVEVRKDSVLHFSDFKLTF